MLSKINSQKLRYLKYFISQNHSLTTILTDKIFTAQMVDHMKGLRRKKSDIYLNYIQGPRESRLSLKVKPDIQTEISSFRVASLLKSRILYLFGHLNVKKKCFKILLQYIYDCLLFRSSAVPWLKTLRMAAISTRRY